MTWLWITLGVVGYLAGALVTLRIIYHLPGRHDSAEAVFGAFWPAVAFTAALVLPFIGIWRLSRLPTRRERRLARVERMRKHIAELERDLGIGSD